MTSQLRSAPRSPAEWVAAAEDVFREFVAAVGRYGVAPDRGLRLEAGTMPMPYYDSARKTIGVGMPDPETVRGRLQWIFFARVLGMEGPDEAIAAFADQLPWTIAHEVTHHLRHHYGSPMDNHFVEEHVANIVAVSFLNEHPTYRETLPRLRALSIASDDRLSRMSPEAEAHRRGFRYDISEVLVGQRALTHWQLSRMRHYAKEIDEPLDRVLRESDLASDREIALAEEVRTASESYFNGNYSANVAEYSSFFSEWFRAYLRLDDIPSLAEALEEHVLTDDWEAGQRRATVRFLMATLNHSLEDVAAAAVEALTDELGRDSSRALLDALDDPRPKVVAAALVGLASVSPGNERAIVVAKRLASSDDPMAAAAAAQFLLRSAGGARLGRDTLERLLDGSETERFVALRTLSGLRGDRRAAAAATRALSDPSDRVRLEAATLLGRCPASPRASTALARALDDPYRSVRDAAGASLRAHGVDAVPALRSVKGTLRARVNAALVLDELRARGATRRLSGRIDEVFGKAATLDRMLASIRSLDGKDRALELALAGERERLGLLAVRLAGALGRDRETMELARRGLASDRGEVRNTALELAVRAAPAALGPRLIALLGPSRGAARTPRHDEPLDLESLLRDPDSFVREAAGRVDIMRSGRPAAGPESVDTSVEKLMFLRSVQLFRSVELDDLRPEAESFLVERYSRDETVFSAGDDPEGLFLVVSGRVGIERESADGGLRVAELGPGQWFGETGLLTGRPHTVTSVALRESTVLRLTSEGFRRIGARHPEVLLRLAQGLAERLDDSQAILAAEGRPPAEHAARRRRKRAAP